MKNNPLLGFSLALIATLTWGMLPIAVKPVIQVMQPQTLVWYRFLVAGLGLFLLLAIKRKLPAKSKFRPSIFALILLGALGLVGNFIFSHSALHYISPTTVQVLWQLAPFSMIICGVLFFKERFGTHQKIGLLLLILGLGAFFNNRLAEIMDFGLYAVGILLASLASIVWVCYGIAQKLLLRHFSSQQILLVIYGAGALLCSPMAAPTQIGNLEGISLICFLYCCFNTLIGYGAYGESLNHWDAAKVSVITTMLPIFTLLFSWLAYWCLPAYFLRPEMNMLSYIGAFIVVAGAIFSVIGDKLFQPRT